jgi:RNA polymerase sigma-70 factor, ECF subfamily
MQTTDVMFAELLSRYGVSLRRIACSYAAASGEEEDLYQELLCQIWRGLPSFRGEAAAGTWLYRVALNTARTYRRQTKRRPPAAPSDGIAEERHAASVGDPTDEAAILQDFLASLGAVDRSVMVLYMEGLAHQEIGEVVGQSAGGVGVRIHRLKALFKQRYVER